MFVLAIFAVGIVTLIALTTVMVSGTAKKAENNAEAQSYLSKLTQMDVNSIEQAINEGKYSSSDIEPTSSEDSDDDSTTTAQVANNTTESEIITTQAPTTQAPTTQAPTTQAPTTQAPTTQVPTTQAPNVVIPAGFDASNLTCYVPYTVDKAKAQSAADAASSSSQIKQIFSNSVFVGDSIMNGFVAYGYIYDKNDISKVGANLKKHLTEEVIKQIASKKPQYVFIHYGLNEISTSDSSLNSFISTYTDRIQSIKKALPKAKIVIMQLTPVKKDGKDYQARFTRIPAYNERLRKMCVDLDVCYYENSPLFTARPELFAKDGYHFAGSMYKIWSKDLIKEMGIY